MEHKVNDGLWNYALWSLRQNTDTLLLHVRLDKRESRKLSLEVNEVVQVRNDGNLKVVAVDITSYTDCSVLVMIPEHCLSLLWVELWLPKVYMLKS